MVASLWLWEESVSCNFRCFVWSALHQYSMLDRILWWERIKCSHRLGRWTARVKTLIFNHGKSLACLPAEYLRTREIHSLVKTLSVQTTLYPFAMF